MRYPIPESKRFGDFFGKQDRPEALRMKRISALIVAFVFLLCSTAAGEDIIFQSEMNQKKNTIRYILTDEAGNPVAGSEGYAMLELEYNSRRKWPEKIRYLDPEGKRVRNQDGYSAIKYDYSANRLVTKITFYDENAKLVNVGEEKYCRITLRYNKEKQIINL